MTSETELVAITVKLGQNSLVVTREALQKASGISMRLVRSVLERVELRSEAEFFALNSTPAMNVTQEVVFLGL